MSDFYEFALLFNIKPDVSQEVIDTLHSMTGTAGSEFTPSITNCELSQSRSIVHTSGITMHVIPAWSTFLREGHSEFEEYLSGSFGTSLRDLTLAIHKVSHEDEFFNAWDDVRKWLASISATTGLIGYYRSIESDSVEETTLIYFENAQISEQPAEDSQTIEDFLQNLDDALIVEEE
jgi:hypothetical protein